MLVTDHRCEPQLEHGRSEGEGDRVTPCHLRLCQFPTVNVDSGALVLHRQRPFGWNVAPLGDREEPWEEDALVCGVATAVQVFSTKGCGTMVVGPSIEKRVRREDGVLDFDLMESFFAGLFEASVDGKRGENHAVPSAVRRLR